MRCCANESGIRAGRGCCTSGAVAPDPACSSSRTASDCTVDASKSARTGTLVSSASPSRAATRVAINEFAAEFEEIVVAANLCDSENFGEHLRDSLFDGRDRRLVQPWTRTRARAEP